MELIEKILITSFCVFAIWHTMKPGEIFDFVQIWFANLKKKWQKPLYDCPICMNPWHGTYVYWIIWGLWLKTGTWEEWLVVILAGIGFNAIVVNNWPPEE